MWIFGQVWFACLVGFAVGVLLDWVVRVRPLSNRVAELEARLASDVRSARSDGEYGRSVFDRGPFAAADSGSSGFVADRNRGGLLTPSGRGGELLDMGEADRPSGEAQSGVEDFPGVARLSEVWEEAEEATRNAPEPWQPIGPAATAAEESWRDTAAEPPAPPEPWLPAAEPDDQPTQVSSWMTESTPEAQPDDATPDDQYLEFLRAGANHAPTEPDLDDPEDGDAVTQGEMAAPGSGEVTSVMPQIEGYEAYESYADEYEQNGYQRNGYREPEQPEQADSDYENNGFQFADYQSEDVEEPAESSTPLPRRRSGESLRFAPFEIPFDAQDAEQVATHPRGGEMTPIEDGGFQPFQKPGDPVSADAAANGTWIGDGAEGLDAGRPAVNGSHSLVQPPMDEDGSSSWFDLSEANPQSSGSGSGEGSGSGLTQRMLPVSRPDLDHPDLLRESVFGTETDTHYDDEQRERSLFEPVVQADSLEDSYQAPAYEGPTFDQPGFQQEQSFGSQESFGNQQAFEDQQTFEQPGFEQPGFEQAAFGQSGFDQEQPSDRQPFEEQAFDQQPEQPFQEQGQFEQEPEFEEPSFEQQFEQQQQQQLGQQQSFDQQPFQEQQQFQEQQPFEQQAFQDQGFADQSFEGRRFEDQRFEDQNFAGQDFNQPGGFESPENALEVTGELPAMDQATDAPVSGEFYDQTQPPRPIRVRTGVDGPVTQTIRAVMPDDANDGLSNGHGGDQPGGHAAPGEGPFGPGSALPHPDGSAPTDGFAVKARTSSMVFHTRSSPFFDRLEPQVWFRTPEDAQRAGFTSWERPRSW